MTKRLETLAQIIEEEKIRKMAQEVGDQPGEIGEAEADKLAQDIFDKLFDEELKNLLQS
jgi:ribosomal protein L16 Arg81 hydroxylase